MQPDEPQMPARRYDRCEHLRDHARTKEIRKLLRCPTCGMLVRPEDEDFPFLQRPLPQDRSRQVGLGRLQDQFAGLDPEVLEDLGGLGGGHEEGLG